MFLPTEIWNEIILNLELKDLYNMMCLNNYFHKITTCILEKKWNTLLEYHNIKQLKDSKNNLTLKELKIYIKLCFVLKKDMFFYDRITLTLFNTQIYKNYFTFNSLNCQSHYTLMIYCPINLHKIEKALLTTIINGKNVKIYNISNYFYNTKKFSNKNISIFKKDFDKNQNNDFITYFLKGIELI
jgi:hypothetical protein